MSSLYFMEQRMRALIGPLIAAALVLAGCGGDDGEEEAAAPTTARSTTAESTSSSPRSATPSPSSTTAVIDPSGAALLTETICTKGIAEPDALLQDAFDSARSDSKPVSEIAASLRKAQQLVKTMAGAAELSDQPALAPALQDYANVLDQGLKGDDDVDLDAILDAREAVNTACDAPS